MTLTVLIVDDQPDFLEYLRWALGRSDDFRVVGTATSGPQALAMAPSLKPDLVIVDVTMPGMSGFEVAERLLLADPPPEVVIMSMVSNPQYEIMARQAGAAGFISKTALSAQALWTLVRP